MKHVKSDSRTQQAFSSIASQCMCVSTSNWEPDAQVSKSTQWLSASQGWWHPCLYPVYSQLVLCSHKATCCHKVHPTLSHFPMTVIQFAFHFTLCYVVYFTIIYELNTLTFWSGWWVRAQSFDAPSCIPVHADLILVHSDPLVRAGSCCLPLHDDVFLCPSCILAMDCHATWLDRGKYWQKQCRHFVNSFLCPPPAAVSMLLHVQVLILLLRCYVYSN